MSSLITPNFYRVYVWQFPVRAFHWINAAAITTLIATGLIISYPVTIEYAPEAHYQFWFGWVRFIHFVAGYVMVANFAMRIYWAFAGNRYARWETFIPMKRKQFVEMQEVLRVDVLQSSSHGKIAFGHNALASIAYLILFLVTILQAATGFALMAPMSDYLIPNLFGWLLALGDFTVRQIHHLLMWYYILFTMVHIYIAFYHDYVEGRGVISSIVGGFKFGRRQDIEDDKD